MLFLKKQLFIACRFISTKLKTENLEKITQLQLQYREKLIAIILQIIQP